MLRKGVTIDQSSRKKLSFIFSSSGTGEIYQRLDGIYFNTDQNWVAQNHPILQTYRNAHGVIFQSNFNKELVTRYFSEHPNACVIHNGADLEAIAAAESITADLGSRLECNGDIWCCASSWRPHKRLNENIRFFQEHSSSNDILVIAGEYEKKTKDKKIRYIGNVTQETLYSIYKMSKYFIHLAWLDHCPNVVCDARGAGCHIICSSSGGTFEVAGLGATIITEEDWDFKPLRLYSPPELDFSKKTSNKYESTNDMNIVSDFYLDFIFRTNYATNS